MYSRVCSLGVSGTIPGSAGTVVRWHKMTGWRDAMKCAFLLSFRVLNPTDADVFSCLALTWEEGVYLKRSKSSLCVLFIISNCTYKILEVYLHFRALVLYILFSTVVEQPMFYNLCSLIENFSLPVRVWH